MWSIKFFSEGIGLVYLAIGVLALLLGLGIWIRRSRMKPYLGNILIPVCMIVLSSVFLVFTFDFPDQEAGPAVIPRLYIFLILILTGIILTEVFRGKEKKVSKVERTGFLALVMAAFIGYFLVMPFLGYFLSTFIFIVLMLHMLSYRKKGFIWLIAGGWVIFSYVTFYKLLYIQLPLGLFEGLF
jgi:putative tricarboxylic transport membrane protein